MMGSGVLGADAAYAGQPIPTTGLPSGDLSVLLYSGTTAGSLSLQTAIPLVGTSLTQPGQMATKGVVLDSIPGGVSAYFQIIIVSSAAPSVGSIVGGSTGNEFIGANYFGTSGLFTFTPGLSVTFPVIYAGTSTWAAQPILLNVPEPSVLPLTGICGVLLTARHRRRVE